MALELSWRMDGMSDMAKKIFANLQKSWAKALKFLENHGNE